jgi:hypothetical protein
MQDKKLARSRTQAPAMVGATGEAPADEVPPAQPCGAGDTVLMELAAYRAEPGYQAVSDQQLTPYEAGFGSYASGTGLADNPYPGDSCAHLHWANGWSQARDETRRQARRSPR